MHPSFQDWIGTFAPTGDLSSMPWKQWAAAVDAWVSEADGDAHVGAVYVAHGRSHPEFSARWRAVLQAHDDSLPDAGDERLLQILAGAALVTARSARSAVNAGSSLALYGVVCAQQAGWVPVLPDVHVDAAALREYGRQARELPSWTRSQVQVTSASFESDLPPAGEMVTAEQLKAALQGLAKGTTEALERHHAAVGRAVVAREAPLREDAALLHWLLSGYSHTLQLPWRQLTALTAAVAAALELDGLTAFDAGLPRVEVLLRTAVDLAGGELQAEVAVPSVVVDADLMPIAASLCPHGDRPPIAVIEPATPADVGIQLYYELRFARAYAAAPS